MANGRDPNRVPAQVATPTVPVGAIGSTIADETPGKVQQFFGNPANLVTMLVAASALSQPGRRGESDFAQVLRSGVGALGFRGNLDREIEDQRTREAEAASVVQGRESQAEIGRSTVAATEDRTAASREATQTQADVTREGLTQESDLEAGRLAQQSELERQRIIADTQLAAFKAYNDARLQAITLGEPPPDFLEYQKAATQALGMAGILGDDELPEFFADPNQAMVPAPGGQDQLPAGVDTPGPVTRPQVSTRVLPASGEESLRNLSDAQINSNLGSSLRKMLPETMGQLSDDQVVATMEQVNASITAELPTMTEARAREILRDRVQRLTLSQENLRLLRQVIAGPVQEGPASVNRLPEFGGN